MPAACAPRFETRASYPLNARGAAPDVSATGPPGERLELMLTRYRQQRRADRPGGLEGVGLLDLLRIEANAQLASLDGLETVASTFRIRENPMLPQCEAEALLAEMQAAGFEGSTMVEFNDESATCE